MHTPYVTVEQRHYTLPDQSPLSDYTIVTEPPGVSVVAQLQTGELLLIEQYRPGPNAVRFDLPGGAVDDGETPLAAAQRELAEETGYISGEWQFVGQLEPAPHRMDTTSHIFLALNCRPQPDQQRRQQDGTEFLRQHRLRPAAVEELIAAGKFQCAICVAAYFLAKQHYFRGGCG